MQCPSCAKLRTQIQALQRSVDTYESMIRTCLDMGEVKIEANGTDMVLAESKLNPGTLGLYGAMDEMLWLVGPECAPFFREVADHLEKHPCTSQI